MRITHINCSEKSGGAAIAAYRLHEALNRNGVESSMAVARSPSVGPSTSSPKMGFTNFRLKIFGKLDSKICRLLDSENIHVHQSAGLFGSDTLRRAALQRPDLLHLHWINGACVSLRQLSSIRLPVIWTLHDTWPFGGLSHYEASHESRWYQTGGEVETAPRFGRFSVWAKRQSLPKGKMIVVAPSNWIGDCARASRVFNGVDVCVIPNCIDTEAWRPADRVESRAALNIPVEATVVLFSAAEGFSEKRKGGDLFIQTIAHLRRMGVGRLLALLVGVSSAPTELSELCEVRALGYVSGTEPLRRLYSASDFVIIPSRLDNLPNVGVEALACGTPVGCFDVGGLPDIVTHGSHGVVAKTFDAEELATGIATCFADRSKLQAMKEAARQFAINRYSESVVAKQYEGVYFNCLERES